MIDPEIYTVEPPFPEYRSSPNTLPRLYQRRHATDYNREYAICIVRTTWVGSSRMGGIYITTAAVKERSLTNTFATG